MKGILFNKRFAFALTGGVVLLMGLLSTLLLPQKTAEAWECQDKNVIRCGVNDRNDLANQIENGDGVHTDIKSIFNTIGIHSDDILSEDTVGGVLRRDGSVWVGSQMVASGTVMGFRQVPGMTGTPWNGLIWNVSSSQFDPSVEQVGAYVYMRGGSFRYAVLVSCGNPVLTSLQPLPQSLAIEKTVKNITAAPTSEYSKSVNAKVGETVEFKVKVVNNGIITVENASIGDILPQHLTLVPGSGVATVREFQGGAWQTVTVSYSDPEVAAGKLVGAFEPGEEGFLVLRAQVTNGLPAGCSTLVDTGFARSGVINIVDRANVVVCLAAPPTPPPVTPVSTPVVATAPAALPASGPIEAAAGVLGTSALGYTGYMWRKSKKKLMNKLKEK